MKLDFWWCFNLVETDRGVGTVRDVRGRYLCNHVHTYFRTFVLTYSTYLTTWRGRLHNKGPKRSLT